MRTTNLNINKARSYAAAFFAALLAVALWFGQPAAAEEAGLTINLTEICDPGCAIFLNVEEARLINGDFVGEVSAAVQTDPLQAFAGVLLSKNAGIRYVLQDYPGQPSFTSLDRVSKFLIHDTLMVRKARTKAGS